MNIPLKQKYPKLLEHLKQMNEWMAFGFYEGIELPWPRAYGLAFRRFYENIEIRIPGGKLLVPCEPFPVAVSQSRVPGKESWYWSSTGPAHHAAGFLVDFNHNVGVDKNYELIAEKKKAFPRFSGLIDDLMSDLDLPYFGDYTHSNPDLHRIITEGFDSMEAALDSELTMLKKAGKEADEEELNLLLAVKDYTTGLRTYHTRIQSALKDAVKNAKGKRKAELELLLKTFKTAFLKPAKGFYEGFLAVNFAWMLDGCDDTGRFDSALGGLFDKDLKNGKLDVPFARKLIDEFFNNIEKFNGWNLVIGGRTPGGRDGANKLTLEVILACKRNKFKRPNVAFRINKETPEEFVLAALDALKNGTGRPALYNDDLYIKGLLEAGLGVSVEDARDLCFGGCTETMIDGRSNVGSLNYQADAFEHRDVNLAKMLEFALYNGYDPSRKQYVGPSTGNFEDFKDFNAFLSAVKRQIQFGTDIFIADLTQELLKRFNCGDPKLYRTFFTRDCVKRRRSFEAGGARYNWSLVNHAGVANFIDSLAAIKKCVFEDKSVKPSELIKALKADFKGYETVRERLKAAPKFGNDDPYVDGLGGEILKFACDEITKHKHPRGGGFLPSIVMNIGYELHGSVVGALPDGRSSFTVLADSLGPFQGRDTEGPTAMLRSVSKLPVSGWLGTPVLNIRFQKKIMENKEGLEACAGLMRSFFEMGGMQMQFSVISKKDMLAAQKEPDKYKDLIVRIGGYSEYFNALSRPLQDSVIARTEHGIK